MTPSGLQIWIQRNKENMSNFTVCTGLADGLTLLGDETFAATVITIFQSRTYGLVP